MAEDFTEEPIADSPPIAGPPLPPQAPTPTDVAQDQADVATAPTSEQALLQANFGDRGAAQYTGLRDAGRAAQPAPGTGPLFNLAGAPSAEGLSNLLGAALTGYATRDPLAGQKMFQAQQQRQLAAQKEFRENASEFYTSLLPAAFKQFPGRPDLAAAFLQNQALSRGLKVDPAVLVKLNQDIIDGKLSPNELDEEMTHGDISTLVRLGGSAKVVDDIIKGRAAAREATAHAKSAELELAAKPGALAQKTQKDALEIASRLRQSQRPPTPQEIDTLDAGGLEVYQVPVPGVAGGTMFSTRPKGSGKPGDVVINASTMRQQKADEAGRTAAAREAATTTAATRTMAETAPKVVARVNAVERTLDSMGDEGLGPGSSRWRDFWSGKIGAEDVEFSRLRGEVNLLTGLLMRMHVGARGGEYFQKKFDDMIGVGRQSPANMREQLDVMREYANDILSEVKNKGVGAEINAPGAKKTAPPPAGGAPPPSPNLAPGAAFLSSLSPPAP